MNVSVALAAIYLFIYLPRHSKLSTNRLVNGCRAHFGTQEIVWSTQFLQIIFMFSFDLSTRWLRYITKNVEKC